MKIALFALKKNKRYLQEIKKEIKGHKFSIVKKNPDIVFSVGGDGTFLFAERKYPSVPKVHIKKSGTCTKCENLSLTAMLRRLKSGRFRIKKISKLQASIKNHKLLAVNDIIIRNKNVQSALRFSIKINNKPINSLIGDGIVVATPYGSTAYFRSIAGISFIKGIGMAFNNTTKKMPPVFLSNKSVIELFAIREKAVLGADNDPRQVIISPRQKVTIKVAKQAAHLVLFS